MAKGKPPRNSLLTGAMAHAAERLKSIIKVQRVPARAARVLLDVVKRGPAGGETQGMMLALTTRGKVMRPLAHVLAEGPIPGRLPRPPKAPPRAPDPARPGFKRAADPSTSFEPVPGELRTLLNTKKITQRSRDAAQRLGFEKNDKGSALESLYQFLYPTLYRQSASRRKPKTPAKGKNGGSPPAEPPPEHAGVWSNIFSPLTEFALNQNPSLLRTEQGAIDRALQQMARNDKTLKMASYAGVPLPPTQKLATGPSATGAVSMLRSRRVAAGVLDVEMFNVRDNTGKTGQPVTDRLRGLLDIRKTPPEFTIVSIGEAKARSKSGEIIGQVVQDVARLVGGLRTSEGGVAAGNFGPAQVKFGPQLVVAVLSEKAPPASHVASLEGQLKAAFKTAKKPSPQMKLETLDVGSTFFDAKTIAREFQSALNELALGPKKN